MLGPTNDIGCKFLQEATFLVLTISDQSVSRKIVSAWTWPWLLYLSTLHAARRWWYGGLLTLIADVGPWWSACSPILFEPRLLPNVT